MSTGATLKQTYRRHGNLAVRMHHKRAGCRFGLAGGLKVPGRQVLSAIGLFARAFENLQHQFGLKKPPQNLGDFCRKH